MNAGQKPFRPIRKLCSTAIMDATPHQLTALLFKAVLDKLAIAEGPYSRGDVPARCDAISKATNIVMELKSTLLTLRTAENVANELDRLYEFSINELLDANSQKALIKLRSVRARNISNQRGLDSNCFRIEVNG